ncbi:MAG TPA: polysaccharide biosynthesis/export family protein [Candidatus Polarisedimenticolaceae bacterium]|nr:polysaccharide biosynthesis/export family protein [Candidatus Polarisedimenticolaceae bacterium]
MNAAVQGLLLAALLAPVLGTDGTAAEPRERSDVKTANVKPPKSAPRRAPTELDKEYKIGPEDVLDIAVWGNAEVSRTVPVRPDGKISLPLLNDVQAAGMTPMELRDALTRLLSEYMETPEVSVILREMHSSKVSVVGEVKTPGRFELKSRASVLDAVAQAGGFTTYAKPERIVIMRFDARTKLTRRIPFDYKGFVNDGGSWDYLFLQPGDVVVVP